MGGPLISFRNISRSYGEGEARVVALDGVSFDIAQGEFVAIMGASGSGKSTFARCLIRLIDPTSGHIHWGDAEVATRTEPQLRSLRHRVQVVFQDPNRSLNPRRTVGQSLIEGAMNFGQTKDQAQALAAELMQQVRLPVEALKRYPSQFSGGQRQRLRQGGAPSLRDARGLRRA